MIRASTRWIFLVAVLPALAADDWRSWLNRGIEAHKSARYQEAVEDFQKSIHLSPNEVLPHLYLGTTWMAQYSPGTESSEKARNAEMEFNTVLQFDPENFTVLQSLASLTYQEAKGITNEDEKLRKLDQAVRWYRRVLAVDPRNKDAYFSLCLIDWVKWYPNVTQSVTLVEEGVSYLAKALEIDPQSDDGLRYKNLLIKESADALEEYRPNLEAHANRWVQQALNAKFAKESGQQAPQRVSITGDAFQQNLIRKVRPVYPQAAKAGRIQGTVRYAAIIGKDGHVMELRLVSGHPLLAVDSTRAAVSQYKYRPTFYNGDPVEVITWIDVNFSIQ
jgi:tetratricopeptide (TPR) repeat protein